MVIRSSSALFKSQNYPRVAIPPPTSIIYRNTSNQNFSIAILFSVVNFRVEIIFLSRTLPKALRARVVSYALGAYKVFTERIVVKTSKGLIRLEIEMISALFNSQK